MFGGKEKQNTKTSSNQSTSGGSSSGLNSLEKATVVEGNVTAAGDFRIEGTLKGDLNCKAKVIIGPSGKIDGNVICRTAMIEGSFEGTLNVGDLLELRQTANVEGEVSYGSIKIEPGAMIQGSIKKTSGSNAKQPSGKKA